MAVKVLRQVPEGERMLGERTVQNAQQWCAHGERWIEKGAHSLAISYLEKAAPVFREAQLTDWQSYALHLKLWAHQLQKRHLQVEQHFAEVMQAYARRDHQEGKSLLLLHLARSVRQQGRTERALVTLHQARALAEDAGLLRLSACVIVEQALIQRRRGSHLRAIQLLDAAEKHHETLADELAMARLRELKADAFLAIHERHEAVALLEDVQSRLWAKQAYRQALSALSTLAALYEEEQAYEEHQRVQQLIHWGGQALLRGEGSAAVSRRASKKASGRLEAEDLGLSDPSIPKP